ncbi:MAG: hypothetical protein C0478_17010 [Planctomyces sp.]|nr:hypothetical protein [Planctomyces sp.]
MAEKCEDHLADREVVLRAERASRSRSGPALLLLNGQLGDQPSVALVSLRFAVPAEIMVASLEADTGLSRGFVKRETWYCGVLGIVRSSMIPQKW